MVMVFGTFVSIATVDKLGRRALFLQGGAQMLASQLVVGTLIALKFGIGGVATDVTKNYASIIVLFICFYVAAFAWSWGPLGWLVPSEIFPSRSARPGRASPSPSTCSSRVPDRALSPQVWPLLLLRRMGGDHDCLHRLLLPETKSVPIEEIILVWKKHWFWSKFISDEDVHVGNSQAV
ncbi:Sugar transporter [Musa troglodytarum]|uniref:Sugar transporter n=1 Tax=Musa troglodytarum TaxID=320322 RepID=A0A9E7EQL8_9LILI|nr:Sugar transporter [Musa troglodytarum]